MDGPPSEEEEEDKFSLVRRSRYYEEVSDAHTLVDLSVRLVTSSKAKKEINLPPFPDLSFQKW